MKRGLAGVAPLAVAVGLVASCGGSITSTGTPGSEAGHEDAEPVCGGAGEPCGLGLTCISGVCVADTVAADATLDGAGDVTVADVAGDRAPGSEASDATGGSVSDVVVADVAGDTPLDAPDAEAGDASLNDVTLDWWGDAEVVDVAVDAPSGPDASNAGGVDASDAGCSPGSTQCLGNSIATCGADGEAGAPWPCATGTCGGGTCTGSTTTATSCQRAGAGLTNCGASNDNCCRSMEVAGGTYYRTYANSGTGPTGEADPASVSGFRLDKYLVTVGRFRQFVGAVLPPDGGAGWRPPAGSGIHVHVNNGNGLNATGGGYEPGWVASDNPGVLPTTANLACDASYATWTASPGSNEERPINCVNWYEAYAFCIWDGGFLPTESESEYAAAGGSQQLEYPWGSTDPGNANQYAIYDCHYPNGSGVCAGVANIAPVGTATLGSGFWGQLDLAGELWEWNLDYNATYVDPCVDCADLTPALLKALRGSNFGALATYVVPPYRGWADSTARSYTIGLRCARTP